MVIERKCLVEDRKWKKYSLCCVKEQGKHDFLRYYTIQLFLMNYIEFLNYIIARNGTLNSLNVSHDVSAQ